MYYLEVFSLLNKFGVRYLVVGGVALVLHGVLRLTADLDLFVDLAEDNAAKFLKALKTLGYKPKLPVDPSKLADPIVRSEWVNKKNMKVFSFIQSKDDYKIIDVFVTEPIPFEEAYKRRQKIKANDVSISVISADDLIALKKASGRDQDIADLKMLKELLHKK